MHHEYTAPIGFAAPYAHWAEILILGIPSFLGPAIVPGHMITLWLWIALRQIEAIETHSGYASLWPPNVLFSILAVAFVSDITLLSRPSLFTFFPPCSGLDYQKSDLD